MLFYEDGRFAEDKIFTFFAMNYIIRKRNSTSGSFFVSNFQKGCPDTLEELKNKIEAGDTTFINSLTYWNKRVKGSTSYWFQKRSELCTWINYHVEKGNGAPNFFITLSCAEHYWPDIIRLIRERLRYAGRDDSECYVGSPKLPQLLNDYSVVVQEYFQQRVTEWLDTVGKEVFGTEHCWVRYEFAPGRGQIHAHLLAISGDKSIHRLSHNILKHSDKDESIRADALGQWAADAFGLTAEVSSHFDEIEVDHDNTPITIRFGDVGTSPDDVSEDFNRIMKHCQYHNCSDFCLRDAPNRCVTVFLCLWASLATSFVFDKGVQWSVW